MKAVKVLLTGGSGLLGAEIKKLLKVDAPSHKELDIISKIKWDKKYDLIIHAAGYTDLVKAEAEDYYECEKVNYQGTINLLQAFKGIPFVFISTEYAKFPNLNRYSMTKFLAEEEVKNRTIAYLIIRTLFKPKPFPHDRAFVDQYTNGDYVDVIAPLIIQAILDWDRVTSKSIYVGTGRKTIFELAKQSNPKIGQMSVSEITSVKLPHDYL